MLQYIAYAVLESNPTALGTEEHVFVFHFLFKIVFFCSSSTTGSRVIRVR
jgi:hypothetical protein